MKMKRRRGSKAFERFNPEVEGDETIFHIQRLSAPTYRQITRIVHLKLEQDYGLDTQTVDRKDLFTAVTINAELACALAKKAVVGWEEVYYEPDPDAPKKKREPVPFSPHLIDEIEEEEVLDALYAKITDDYFEVLKLKKDSGGGQGDTGSESSQAPTSKSRRTAATGRGSKKKSSRRKKAATSRRASTRAATVQ